MNGTFRRLLSLGVVAFFVIVGGLIFHWTVDRVYVLEGQSLMLRYKGPLLFGTHTPAAAGHFADPEKGEVGVIEQLRGPGRHFYCPIWWERTVVDDKIVEPGQVAIVTSNLGGNLETDQFLVDGDLGQTKFKGILRKVFGPGRYRYNPYAYEFNIIETERRDNGNQVKTAGWVAIPTGYVGVVTNLADNPLTKATAGVQTKVLPPGIYPINPREQEVDIIEIGYREKSVIVDQKLDSGGRPILDESGEPTVADKSSGINFPSNDGFPINMDFTAIWGLMPDQAADAVKQFGNVAAVEQKFVVPQIESICRNLGSTKGAVELLVGESRQKFQIDTSLAFQKVMKEKNVTLLYGLVRHIYIPTDVRIPIQNANIADEMKLTREQEQITAKTEAELREAERKVELEAERVRVETEKLTAKTIAEGQKQAEETAAETIQLVAAIDKQTAEVEAQATVVRGEAAAQAEKLLQEATADKFRLAVEAFGSGEAYNNWVFASSLPEDIKLNLFYAGEGTFWTDLNGFVPTLLGKQLQQQQSTQRPAQAGSNNQIPSQGSTPLNRPRRSTP
jgi:regulator of protease activity HflC (stomatin/prohibitin superfamily)